MTSKPGQENIIDLFVQMDTLLYTVQHTKTALARLKKDKLNLSDDNYKKLSEKINEARLLTKSNYYLIHDLIDLNARDKERVDKIIT